MCHGAGTVVIAVMLCVFSPMAVLRGVQGIEGGALDGPFWPAFEGVVLPVGLGVVGLVGGVVYAERSYWVLRGALRRWRERRRRQEADAA